MKTTTEIANEIVTDWMVENSYQDARYLRQLREKVKTALAEERQSLGNLLARIHGDGGHYISEHGWSKAVEDADKKIVGMLDLQAEVTVLHGIIKNGQAAHNDDRVARDELGRQLATLRAEVCEVLKPVVAAREALRQIVELANINSETREIIRYAGNELNKAADILAKLGA